jgi:hypothetical protein
MKENRNTELVEIKTHNFEISKNKLKNFSEETQTDFELDRVKNNDDIDIFKWFDHGVTGKELNKLISQIQKYFFDINNTQIKIIKEFGEVYNTFESLDKEYIKATLLSIEGIKKTNEKLEENIHKINKSQNDIEKILDNQKSTLSAIIKFKNKIENYGIEEIKENIKKLENSQKEISDILTSLPTKFENKTDENTELKLKKLGKRILISNILFGLITVTLFLLFFIGRK